MEDYPEAVLVNSVDHCSLALNEAENPTKESFIISSTGTGFISANIESGASSTSSIWASEDTSVEDRSRVAETSDRGKHLSESKELVYPYHLRAAYNHNESYMERNSSRARASSSVREQQTSDPVNVSANMGSVNDIDNLVDKGVVHISPETVHASSGSHQEIEVTNSNGMSVGNDTNSGSLLAVSDIPSIVDSQGHESLQDTIPSGLGFLVSNRDQEPSNGSVVHVDVVSISSNVLSSTNADISSREARRNSRRLFWDAFSRRNSRRHSDSPSLVFSTDDADDLGPHGRWLLDFSGDLFEDGVVGDSGYMGSRIHSMNERRRLSRSEIWERLRGGIDENGRRTTFCPSGIHPDGTCSCDSFLMNEESSTRASISRIVMLAEALFEVLDEIHRQPLSLSLSMVSLPAPESVVDSFPLKNHKKPEIAKCGDDVEQCYICLAEYEEGDKIRVLPCHHEYHMSCVDKWLKEIHGVCPLCRGDVCEGLTESSVSNPENLSV